MVHFNKLSTYVVILALYGLSPSASFATTCGDSESLKTLQEQSDYRGALQEIDKCLGAAEQPSVDDLSLFNDLMKQVLATADNSTLEEVYRNFQSVLKTHLLRELEFEFADYFKTHAEDDAKLFSEARVEGETYYFYYDTGRMLSHSRGIALTDKSLIWKNLTGGQQRLMFDDVKSMTLVYERGLSLTGWKLRVNNNEEYDIRLSGVPEEAIQPLVSAIIYFINSNKTTTEKELIALEVPEREVAILAGWVTLCSDKQVAQGEPIDELQLLDACLSSYGKEFKLSQTDNELLNKLTSQIFAKDQVSFEQAYENFKVILSTQFFNDLNFKFKDNLDENTQSELFKEVRESAENYYFYFDSGTIASGSRGLALTDQAIIWKNLVGSSISWKNLTGKASRVAFDEIESVTLIHEVGLQSITGWKLRLNDKEDYDIVLSKLYEDNVELFASTLVYLINSGSKTVLALQIPKETQDVLTKTFLERHPKIKSVTDSIFGVLMPKKTEEGTTESAEEEVKVEEPKPADESSAKAEEPEGAEATPSEESAEGAAEEGSSAVTTEPEPSESSEAESVEETADASSEESQEENVEPAEESKKNPE